MLKWRILINYKKNEIMKKAKSIIVLLVTLIASVNATFAQGPSCNYYVHNSHDCDVNVTVVWYEAGATVPCYGITGTVASNGNTPFNCLCSGTIGNVVVIINYFDVIAGTPVSPSSLDINNQSLIAGSIITGGGACGGYSFNASWALTSTDIGN